MAALSLPPLRVPGLVRSNFWGSFAHREWRGEWWWLVGALYAGALYGRTNTPTLYLNAAPASDAAVQSQEPGRLDARDPGPNVQTQCLSGCFRVGRVCGRHDQSNEVGAFVVKRHAPALDRGTATGSLRMLMTAVALAQPQWCAAVHQRRLRREMPAPPGLASWALGKAAGGGIASPADGDGAGGSAAAGGGTAAAPGQQAARSSRTRKHGIAGAAAVVGGGASAASAQRASGAARTRLLGAR
jgi:hypothetical protein